MGETMRALEFAKQHVRGNHAEVTWRQREGKPVVRVTLRQDARAPGMTITVPQGRWDIDGQTALALDITNRGKQEGAFIARAQGNGWIDGIVVVGPGKTETLWVILKRGHPPEIKEAFPAMNGCPGEHVWLWSEVDPKTFNSIQLYAVGGKVPQIIEVSNLRVGRYAKVSEPCPCDKKIFPFVDRYGQYMHREWPGKISGKEDLARIRKKEKVGLTNQAGPKSWNRYGGWRDGPQREATGHFRVEQVKGKWWLVDPLGRLFWSHGVTCVNTRETTRVKGRERFFAATPPGGKQAAKFSSQWGFNFYSANLWRKYGEDWWDTAARRAHVRLRSWGMNTIANWSEEGVYKLDGQRTPYTVAVHYSCPQIGKKFPDVNHKKFRPALRAALEKAAQGTADDPWCIGYFVNNELHWPRKNRAKLAETYYRICREEARRAAPDKLYLGSRLNNWDEDVTRAAGRHCDVISINRYQLTAADYRLPRGMDRPVVIGEFHFGALDRGMLHTGLRSVGSQAQRGKVYELYVRGALRHRHIVGTHWFQYHDQNVTGRGDGENYQIGFLDICDTPYGETVTASREVGYTMYQYRSQ